MSSSLKFRTKIQEVEAVQFLGQEIDGFMLRKPQLIFSERKDLYYVDMCEPMSAEWLSVDKKENGKYNSYPFVSYSIHSNRDIEDADEKNELVKRYLELFNRQLGSPVLYYDGADKNEIKIPRVNLTDWVVVDNGVFEVYTLEEFAEKFESNE